MATAQPEAGDQPPGEGESLPISSSRGWTRGSEAPTEEPRVPAGFGNNWEEQLSGSQLTESQACLLPSCCVAVGLRRKGQHTLNQGLQLKLADTGRTWD